MIGLYTGYYIYSYTNIGFGKLFDIGAIVNQDELDDVLLYVTYLVFVSINGALFYIAFRKILVTVVGRGQLVSRLQKALLG